MDALVPTTGINLASGCVPKLSASAFWAQAVETGLQNGLASMRNPGVDQIYPHVRSFLGPA